MIENHNPYPYVMVNGEEYYGWGEKESYKYWNRCRLIENEQDEIYWGGIINNPVCVRDKDIVSYYKYSDRRR